MDAQMNAALSIFAAVAKANPSMCEHDELILAFRQGGFCVHAFVDEARAVCLDGVAEACAQAGVPFCICDGDEQSVVFYDSEHPAWKKASDGG